MNRYRLGEIARPGYFCDLCGKEFVLGEACVTDRYTESDKYPRKYVEWHEECFLKTIFDRSKEG